MNDDASILLVQAASVDAWNRGDLPGHLAIYDASVITMTRAGPRCGLAAIDAAFRASYFRDDTSRPVLRMEQVEVRMLSTQSALMTGRYVLSGPDTPDASGWYSLVWLRTAGGWRVIHDHSN